MVPSANLELYDIRRSRRQLYTRPRSRHRYVVCFATASFDCQSPHHRRDLRPRFHTYVENSAIILRILHGQMEGAIIFTENDANLINEFNFGLWQTEKLPILRFRGGDSVVATRLSIAKIKTTMESDTIPFTIARAWQGVEQCEKILTRIVLSSVFGFKAILGRDDPRTCTGIILNTLLIIVI